MDPFSNLPNLPAGVWSRALDAVRQTGLPFRYVVQRLIGMGQQAAPYAAAGMAAARAYGPQALRVAGPYAAAAGLAAGAMSGLEGSPLDLSTYLHGSDRSAEASREMVGPMYSGVALGLVSADQEARAAARQRYADYVDAASGSQHTSIESAVRDTQQTLKEAVSQMSTGSTHDPTGYYRIVADAHTAALLRGGYSPEDVQEIYRRAGLSVDAPYRTAELLSEPSGVSSVRRDSRGGMGSY